jgi:nucleotide-binding universal stress UspA family protein
MNKVLVACDSSQASDRAVAWTGSLQRQLPETEVVLFHAAGFPATVTKLPMSGSGPEEFAGLRGKLEALAAECGLRAKVLIEVSPAPAAAIMATAEELGCDLIVLGTHGRSGLARAVLGSVAEGVVRGAPCPVVVMRAL